MSAEVVRLREGFAEISSGWMLISGMEDITDRIERLGKWILANGGTASINTAEHATLTMMISKSNCERDGARRFLRGEGRELR